MPTSQSDAVAQRPTLEQEISRFKGFSTTDGQVSDGAPSDEEKARIAADAAQAAKDKGAAGANQQRRAIMPGEQIADGEVTDPDAEGETEEEKAERLANETPEEKAAREEAEAASAQRAANAGDPNRRIRQAVAKQRQAEAALNAANARHASDMASMNARLQALETGQKPGGAAQTVDTSGKPDPTKYEFGELDTRYIEALTDWKVDQKLNARQATQQQQTLTAEQQENQRKFAEAKATVTDAGRAKYEDFDEVVLDTAYHPVNNPGGWLLSETVGKLALTSPVGQDVLYHLASDPKEAARMYRLPPMEQAAYFGALAAQFTPPAEGVASGKQKADGQQPNPAIKTPKAPPPPNVKGKGAGAKTTVPGDTTDFAAFERAAMARK